MVDVVEIVVELEASGFINGGTITRGRVVRRVPGGELICQVDDGVKGVAVPSAAFEKVEDARAAIISYWDQCNKALESNFWNPKAR
ncbi:hypothetical protein ACSSUR_24650 [Pseudomonas cedrina]|uniref:hypothetical protein n=1 Tax=Pseudomonas cedrina TaxID=651740 RepID=UPI003EDA4BBC